MALPPDNSETLVRDADENLRRAQNANLLVAPAFELASRQASLAYERTLVSIDQSLMSAIRTSLSLIGFGFAMVLFFNTFGGRIGVDLQVPARNFGLSLVAMGI